MHESVSARVYIYTSFSYILLLMKELLGVSVTSLIREVVFLGIVYQSILDT